MKHFAKWTFLLVMAGLIGFSATVLATQSTRLARMLSQDDVVAQDLMPQEMLSQDVGAALEQAFAEAENVLDVDLATLEVAGLESMDNPPAAAFAPVEGAASQDLPLLVQAQTGAPAAVDEQAPLSQAIPGVGLNAVGTVEVTHARQVVLATNGEVEEIAVEVGDSVRAGDLLIALDTTFLDWALEQAEIGFETARINFEELGESVLDSDIAVAEANLLLARENLVLAQEGPTAEELAAAQASVAAAWARHEELQQQPTQAQINQALANLRRAEVNVEGAQREYDKIAWLPEASATAASDALQSATIDLEAAKAAFEEANRPATESELQNAVASAHSAQANLNQLRRRPTAAEIAQAEANLASAEAAYEQALLGPKESDMRIGELSVRQAMIGMEQARLAVENARVTAPIDGTVLSVEVELGQQASSGSVVATLADPLDVRLVVNVEQRDIRMVSVGQGVEISVYAHPDVIFLGVVDKIAPSADAGTSFVTFPVIIELVDGPIERLLPGMTASATFLIDAPATEEADEEDAAAEEPVDEPLDEPVEEAVEEDGEDAEDDPAGLGDEMSDEDASEDADSDEDEEEEPADDDADEAADDTDAGPDASDDTDEESD